MSAAVAHSIASLPSAGPRSSSRNASSSMEKKKNAAKLQADKVKQEPSTTKDTSLSAQQEPAVPVKQPPDGDADTKPAAAAAANAESTSQPLAPPPRPAQDGPETSSADYFSGSHKTTHYSLEPNLFEQSFGKPPDTPGKSILPPVASLTSPSLTGNASLGGGYDWSGSLRSGPLSPAMLSGPTGPGDYFDSSLRGSFPTPNESSLRTGLTPGGGGSMFPAPSPNSQALFQSLANGGATPGTLDFHRTALNAKVASKSDTTSRPSQAAAIAAPAVVSSAANGATAATATAGTSAPTQTEAMGATQHPPAAQNFAQHDNEAANGLYLLAQAGNESQAGSQFTAANRPPAAQDKKRGRNVAAPNGVASDPAGEVSETESKPNVKKAKKAAGGKAGGKNKKADETPAKPVKRAKSAASPTDPGDMDEYDSDDGMDGMDSMGGNGGKKMTDEEKRKNFLERNRVAALKCRQRKKQWLANLQAKVEIFSSENDQLNAQVNSLREEILNLKTILIAHKDCPIAQQQQAGQYMAQHQQEYSQPNPYGMQMQPGQAVMAAGPRRYS